ncbi:annexin B9-like [Haliotis rufescens]|uniref:annexin B9-like n=1 Tax=Haliotis rufescens TaxID=6454 RepID=UPI001EB095AE|nr:annexin B9-like [Haliotis rufescens]
MPGTIYGISDLDAGAVAETLRNAMSGFGTDEDQVLVTVSNLSNEQRQEVATAFKQAYGKDLIDDLKSELRGDFEEVVVAAMAPPRALDARQIHYAISGAGTDETTIVEIMCTRSNDEINQIKEIYKEEFESELEDDLTGDTSGYFQRMFVSLCAGGREEGEDVDDEKATEDAQKFHDAGEGCWGTEEAEFNAVLCLRSQAQIRATIEKYEELHGSTMEDAIRSECGGDLQNGFLAIVEAAKNTPAYFARRAHDAMAGLGTSDNDLIRVIVSRSEVDLEEVKEAYQNMYETTLSEAVASECGGDYKKMLLNLIDPQY